MLDFSNAVPTTDEETIDRIRSLGHPKQMTEIMLGLYGVKRELGSSITDAFKAVLIASLSDETIEKMAPMVPECAEELAFRKREFG